MIVRLAVILVLLYVLFRVARGLLRLSGGKQGKEVSPQRAGELEDLVPCAQCQTYAPVSQVVSERVDGKTVHFCSPACRARHAAEKRAPAGDPGRGAGEDA